MTTYILQMHTYNAFPSTDTRHTGYSLIIKNDDGTIIMKSVDFGAGMPETGIISIIETNAHQIQDSRDNVAFWDTNTPTNVIQDKNLEINTVLTGANALDAFNKIKLEATLTNMAQIEYDLLPNDFRVCNTATQYWAEKYINTIAGHENDNVFEGLSGDFYGKDDDYINASSYQQAQKLKFIGNIIDTMGNLGKIDDMLTSSSPYISDKYLSILKPYLESELAYNGEDIALENMLNNIVAGTLSLFSLGGFQTLIRQLTSGITSQILPLFSTAEETRSPLVVDLDGDGVETVSENNGVYFDHDNNNFAEKSGWAGKDDGLLVRDINGNGTIDDGTELFGNNSVLASGQKASNGFEALKDITKNDNSVLHATINSICCLNIVA